MKKGEAGYFYLGTTRPTAWDYQTLSGVISTYTSISEAYGTTVSIAAGETLYMLCPEGWMEGKSVEIEDGNGNTFNFLEDFDATTISGYVIYKTEVWNNAAEITLITPTTDYYVGWATGVNSGYDAFEALTTEQLVSLSSSYSKSVQPTYNKTITSADLPSNRQIFFLMWRNGSAPQSGTITSVGIPTYYSAADFLDSSKFDAVHSAVTIDGETYTVAGYRGSFDPNDTIVINF